MKLKSITLFPDGTFSGFDMDGNFVTSGPGRTIWDSLKTLKDGLKAPWMSDRDAYEQAASAHNVRLTFNALGQPTSVVALPPRTA